MERCGTVIVMVIVKAQVTACAGLTYDLNDVTMI
jgi:hypothetical protein